MEAGDGTVHFVSAKSPDADHIGLKITGSTGLAPVATRAHLAGPNLADLVNNALLAPFAVQFLNTPMTQRARWTQPIRWIGRRRFDAGKLAANPALVPVPIKAGALGPNQPAADLLVSPQHRILLRSRIARRMFGADEILVAAKQLLLIEGVDLAHDLAAVEYVHLLFDRHEVVQANGTATESLCLGPQALESLPAKAVAEIMAIFQELAERLHAPLGARLLASGRQARKLAHRHARNGRPLVA